MLRPKKIEEKQETNHGIVAEIKEALEKPTENTEQQEFSLENQEIIDLLEGTASRMLQLIQLLRRG